MNFKVGDKVRCIDAPDGYPNSWRLYARKAYRIQAVKHEHNHVQVKGNDVREDTWFSATRFELVKPNRR
jgi:hypothetical protein